MGSKRIAKAAEHDPRRLVDRITDKIIPCHPTASHSNPDEHRVFPISTRRVPPYPAFSFILSPYSTAPARGTEKGGTAVRSGKGRLWLYLVYAIAVTAMAATVTLSRYTAAATGVGTAAAAQFVAELTPLTVSPEQLPDAPGKSAGISFSVTNEKEGSVSEVAQTYTVTVRSSGNLPLTFTLAPSGSTPAGVGTQIAETVLTAEPLSAQEGISAGTPAAQGSFPAGTGCVHAYTLTVAWPEGKNSADYANEIDALQIEVRTEQVAPS